MFQIDHSREFVVVHEIVFLELKVIGAAQRFFRAAQELRTAYRAYLRIYSSFAASFCCASSRVAAVTVTVKYFFVVMPF